MSEVIRPFNLEGIPGLAFTYAPEGTTEFVNHRLLDYLGRPLKELQTWAFNDTMYPADFDRVTREWRANIAAGRSYVIEHRMRRADGVYRWAQVNVAPRHDASGRLIGWCGIVFDIDDAKRSGDGSRFNDDAQQLLIDSFPGLVYTMTPRCEIELVNCQVREYFGRSFEGLRNWDRSEFLHPDDLARVRESLCRTVEFGAPHEVEQRLRRADGGYRWFKPRAFPKRDAHGQIVRWYVLLSDIDDLKRGWETLRRAAGRFSRGGFIDRAISTTDRVFRNGNVTAEVVTRIRSLYRQSPPVKQLLNMNDLIERISGCLQEDLRERNVTLRLDLQNPLPLTSADCAQMQQLIADLIKNAIEAMDEVRQRPRELSIQTRLQAGEIVVRIDDCGTGLIHPDVIFEPFYTTKSNGMGIGLSICRSIIDAHGGRLWAAPNVPYGTTIRFAIPMSAPRPR